MHLVAFYEVDESEHEALLPTEFHTSLLPFAIVNSQSHVQRVNHDARLWRIATGVTVRLLGEEAMECINNYRRTKIDL